MGEKGRPSKLFTRAEREEAESNGVSYHTLCDRYYRGWGRHEAITTPLQKTSRKHWIQRAERNGINRNTFISRVRRGISEEDAATITDLKAERRKRPLEPQDDTPRQIKQLEGRAPIDVVAQQYGKTQEEVQTIWRYFA